ncbi:MAG: (2Fe-2S)-binding protein [Alphaproteobacteria bacterium]|nr:(2Fe-2S)-binding protein [Alphaproteobacteria bacterium]
MDPTSDTLAVSFEINGRAVTVHVEPRRLLSDVIRHDLRLTGTHVACEHGVCGSCTVLLDGAPVRSCLLFAVQVDGCKVDTVESLATPTPEGGLKLHHLQQAFHLEHGLQCGYCTPGLLMTLLPWLEQNPSPTEADIRQAISGNLCRCTGYHNIVKAVQRAIALSAEEG